MGFWVLWWPAGFSFGLGFGFCAVLLIWGLDFGVWVLGACGLSICGFVGRLCFWVGWLIGFVCIWVFWIGWFAEFWGWVCIWFYLLLYVEGVSFGVGWNLFLCRCCSSMLWFWLVLGGLIGLVDLLLVDSMSGLLIGLCGIILDVDFGLFMLDMLGCSLLFVWVCLSGFVVYTACLGWFG